MEPMNYYLPVLYDMFITMLTMTTYHDISKVCTEYNIIFSVFL